MLIKNVSFIPIEALKEDTKTIVKFGPQQVREVSDEDGKWFLTRYNDREVIFAVPTPAETAETKAETVSSEVAEEVKKAEESPYPTFVCTICGRVNASKAGLVAHMRAHAKKG